MNGIRLSGTGSDRPSDIYDGMEILISLKSRDSSSIPGHPPDIAYMSKRTFDAPPKPKGILMGGKHRRVRMETPGHLEQIIGKLETERRLKNLEAADNQRRLLPQGAK